MADEYTDGRSQPGRKLNTGTDDRELFLIEFGGMVLEAWERTVQYDALTFQKTITSGKADTFPIIGRTGGAAEHEPGAKIVGGTVEHNEVQVFLDKLLYDAAFIAEIDQIMANYELAGPYARQLGESLAVAYDKRVAAMHILASRVTVAPYTGGPLPSYSYDTNMKTDPSKLEDGIFAAVQHIKENDIGGGDVMAKLPWAQHLLLARYAGFQGGVPAAGTAILTGQDARRSGVPFPIAGVTVGGTNNIPSTNITTGPTKFRGNFSTTVGHISNRMAVATLNARGLRVTMTEQPDRFGTLLIASKFVGHGLLRPECSFELATAVRA